MSNGSLQACQSAHKTHQHTRAHEGGAQNSARTAVHGRFHAIRWFRGCGLSNGKKKYHNHRRSPAVRPSLHYTVSTRVVEVLATPVAQRKQRRNFPRPSNEGRGWSEEGFWQLFFCLHLKYSPLLTIFYRREKEGEEKKDCCWLTRVDPVYSYQMRVRGRHYEIKHIVRCVRVAIAYLHTRQQRRAHRRRN